MDKACKEMGMEKLLQDLQNVWKELNFDYEDHATGNNDTNLVFLENCVKKLPGYKLMRTSEELIETLEENLVAVQNMMTSKYIAFFFNEVSAWQKTLSTVDLVISRWATRQA